MNEEPNQAPKWALRALSGLFALNPVAGLLGQAVVIGVLEPKRVEHWSVACVPIALLALSSWRGALLRLHALADTPTSRVASAAQGFVELTGQAWSPIKGGLTAPLSRQPCVWFRFRVEERVKGNNEYRSVVGGVSHLPIWLDDGSGLCWVELGEAELKPLRIEQWHRGGKRYTEELILPSDELYAIGAFSTLNKEQVAEKLVAEMEYDDPEAAEHARTLTAAHGAMHQLTKPVTNRPFIVSGQKEKVVMQHYRYHLWAQITIFMGTMVFYAVALGMRF